MTGNLFTIVFFSLLLILLIFTGRFFYLQNKKEEQGRDLHNLIQTMTDDAIFIALIVLMTFVPYLGYISVFGGVITFTLLHLPVLLGASLMGWKKGALYGLAFGFFNWIRALTAATSPFDMLFMNPLIAILPRILFGLFAGLLFELLRFVKKESATRGISVFLAILSTAIHTVLVFGAIYLFTQQETAWLWSWLFGGDASALGMSALALTALGAGGEAALAGFLVPGLHIELAKALPRAFPSEAKLMGGSSNA
ncbi:MAG: ECF transporter S component [Bacilli bacterium]|nr:ECF transporter S component [Bacilli bacterium]